MWFNALISAQDLLKELSNPLFRVIDCRFNLSDTSWGKKNISNLIFQKPYAHLDRDLSSPIIPGKTGRHPLPDPEKLTALFSRWGIKADTQVVVYDQGAGGIAARLWWLLRWLGHDRVAVLDGGWTKWTAAGHPVSDIPFTPVSGVFQPKLREESVVDREELKNNLSHYRLIDAREKPRYLGETEPIDPVAGHIPGAKSLPFAENLGENGFFHSPETLRKRFEKVLGSTPSEEAVFYCGSGVTACHNLLAMTHAGLPTGKLYAGSWSEWITESESPVAIGEE